MPATSTSSCLRVWRSAKPRRTPGRPSGYGASKEIPEIERSPMSVEKAKRLQELHRRDDLLVVTNAWDVGSARVIEAAGFPTVASSSAAFAYSIGAQDGERASWEDVITGLARMAAGVSVPVSADLEGGYVSTTGSIEATVDALVDAGVAG